MSLPYPTRLGLIAALGSIALLGGAYYFQYVVGLAPCDMCLWQRYPHMLAILFGLLTLPLMAAPRVALVFALTAILALFVTSGIGVFHAGVEYHWWAGPQACSGRIPRRPVGRGAEEVPAGRPHGPLRRGGVEDVGHLDGRLERDPVGRAGVPAVGPRHCHLRGES